MLRIAAGEFKSKCLKLMDLAEQKRETIIITKRGIPVAKLVPYNESPPPLFGHLKGTLTISGNIIEGPKAEWDAESE